MYTFEWFDETETEILGGAKAFASPMHEEPLKLIPIEARESLLQELNRGRQAKDYKIKIKGEVNPADRFILDAYMQRYGGDWNQAMNHVRIKRLVLSEKDRIGIGTFNPKMKKIKIQQNLPETSTIEKLPSMAQIPIPVLLILMVSLILPIAVLSNLSRCSS